MGKATGFLEYGRKENKAENPCERIKNFNEFHQPLLKEERQNQGARCMNCGIPFCQSAVNIGGMVTGCPLHNLIPEWNDEIYRGNWKMALARLLKSNNFPEFTGRVCPALCEAACTCGLYDDPVTVKANELFIVEYGFKHGYIKARPPETRTDKKVAVIGSGPSGLACADSLNRRGHNVTVFEKEDKAGGLLMYGIPNMKLEKTVVKRRIDLMKEEGVKFVFNKEIKNSKDAIKLRNDFDAVIICCGAGNPRDVKVEGRKAEGIYFAVDFLKANTKSLLSEEPFSEGSFISAKDKDVVVIGGGDTGNDCVGTVIRHGCKSVVQLEMMPQPPKERPADNPWPRWPKVLKTDYGQEEAMYMFGKDPRVYCTTVKSFKADEKGKIAAVETVKVERTVDKNGVSTMQQVKGSEEVIPAQLVLIAAGFLGPDPAIAKAFCLETTERSNIKTLPDKYITKSDGIFSAGDSHRGQSLVVWAISEGRHSAKEVDLYLMNYSNMVE